MPNQFDSKKLRELAEEILEATLDGEWTFGERADLVTSLVRQWRTCDGNATLFAPEFYLYLSVCKTPLGNYNLTPPQPGDPGWVQSLEEDWNINPDHIPSLLTQLNLGQCAEVVNDEGIPLRVWVNPKERREGVEPLVKRPSPPPQPMAKEEYRWLAARHLSKHLLMLVDEKELEILVNSVVSQWERYQGHACIFLDKGRELALTLTNKAEEPVDSKISQVSLEKCLADIGFVPNAIPKVIADINRGLTIRCHDPNGVAIFVWHDPKERRIKRRLADQPNK